MGVIQFLFLIGHLYLIGVVLGEDPKTNTIKVLYVYWIGVYGLFGEQYCYGILSVVLGCVC